MNICKEIRCPFARREGCERYSVSNLCPVAKIDGVRPNQYFVYGDEQSQVEQAAKILESDILLQEGSILELAARRRFGRAPRMVWDI